jgi:hypothetical protein
LTRHGIVSRLMLPRHLLGTVLVTLNKYVARPAGYLSTNHERVSNADMRQNFLCIHRARPTTALLTTIHYLQVPTLGRSWSSTLLGRDFACSKEAQVFFFFFFLFLRDQVTDADAHTRAHTHLYEHMHAHTTPMSTSEELSWTVKSRD